VTSRALRRRIAELEHLAPAFVRKRYAAAKARDAKFAEMARTHAINLGLLLHYGEPKIDEPLPAAWQRCIETFPGAKGSANFGHPFESSHARKVAERVADSVLAALPGADETEKFTHLLASAPPWFLYYTWGDVTAKFLGLPLPDFSSVEKFVRSEASAGEWPAMPKGKFECRPWPEVDEQTRERKSRKYLQFVLGLNDTATPRERRRAAATYNQRTEFSTLKRD